ncbi:MAG: class I SAM-dependent methyltransferase [Microlunatus sp.]|nr:class I SAM-dependent methyltransferase [Microlunatus sp.]
MAESLSPHEASNRRVWDQSHSAWFGRRAARQWAAEPHWGVWAIPEEELHVLPDLNGKDLIDLGCGTGYIGAWTMRRGGRPVGIDNSAAQLATARRLQDEFDLHFPLIHGSAEDVPLPDATFDIAISEHGASGWCDPYRWIPEASRLLRRGGQLIFMRNSTLLTLCDNGDDGPAGVRLTRAQTSLPRIERADGGVNFQLPTGAMIAVLRAAGLVVDELVEIIVPSTAGSDFDYVSVDWASKWPSAELWKATKIN